MKQKRLSNLILTVVFFAGLSLLLYPTVSDCWNSLHQTRAVSSYTSEVSRLGGDRCLQILEDARAYNQAILNREKRYRMTEEDRKAYNAQLNISGNGVMGYLEIPAIDVSLPVYHTAEESVLQVGVGHVEWSSLPVGGGSTHSVLSGHRGLPSARLFTDLDKIVEGDVFLLHILDEVLTYQVDQIRIAEPAEVDDLNISPKEDYCTLVTCTPYGINSHRLLVRGRRMENRQSSTED